MCWTGLLSERLLRESLLSADPFISPSLSHPLMRRRRRLRPTQPAARRDDIPITGPREFRTGWWYFYYLCQFRHNCLSGQVATTTATVVVVVVIVVVVVAVAADAVFESIRPTDRPTSYSAHMQMRWRTFSSLSFPATDTHLTLIGQL